METAIDNPIEVSEEKIVEDDNPSVTSLRNLLRNGRINKSQYEGSLATLLATGIINKSQFTRLKNAN